MAISGMGGRDGGRGASLFLVLFLGAGALPSAPAAAQEEVPYGPSNPPPRMDPPPNGPGAPLPERVGRAIDAGVAWLKRQPAVSGSFGPLDPAPNYLGGRDTYLYPAGPTALSLYTLLKCGVPADDPVVEKGFAWLRKGESVPRSSYEISALILAIEARSNPWKRETERKRDAEDRARRGKAADLTVRLPPKDHAWMKDLVAQLMRRRQRPAGWRYNIAEPPATGVPDSDADLGGIADMSSTQLAMLALGAAERCGIRQPDEVYLGVLEWTLSRQEEEGPAVARFDPAAGGREGGGISTVSDRARGWAYLPESRTPSESAVTGSMTACGLANLVLCRAVLEERKSRVFAAKFADRTERAWWDGAAWFQSHWSIPANPHGSSYYYYLYCIERVGDLKGIRLLAGHDWYTEGASHFVDAQYADGSWWSLGGHMPCDLLGTCFALLFLNRSTGAVATGEEE